MADRSIQFGGFRLWQSVRPISSWIGYSVALDPIDWKPMPSIEKGVQGIGIQQQGQYRVNYIETFAEVVHVLHTFEKSKNAEAGY